MKRILRRILGLLTTAMLAIGCGSSGRTITEADKPKAGASIYDIELKTLNLQENIDLSQFKGRYVLFVNVASKCGYTPQYDGLQALYEANSDKLMIVGLPCNQFGLQEPGDSAEIANFCRANYGVSFPISEKLDVKGKNQHPVYQWLTSKELNNKDDYSVSWNFNKFLVSPDGELLAYFGSKVEPMGEEIRSLLK